MKRIVKIFLVAIVIVSLLTVIKRQIVPILMGNANYGITSLERHGTDILFMGSSMFRQGIDTKDLNIEGKNTYLLSYNGFQPYAEYITLKEVLAHTDIECLVIDMYLYSVAGEAKMSDTRLFLDQSTEFIIDLFSQMKKYGDADYYDLFEMLVQSNNETFFTWPVSYPLINKRYYRGSKISESKGTTAQDLDSIEMMFEKDLDLNQVQLTALDNMIELCNEKGIDVVFLETPKYKRMYEDESYTNGMQLYLDYLNDKNVKIIISDYTAKFCSLNKLTKVYEYDSSDPEMFTDLIHISSAGRDAFTQTILPYFTDTH